MCVARVRTALGEALRAARVQRADVAATLAGAAEALQSVSDAAHGRWVKLLGARWAPLAAQKGVLDIVI